jgi:hypothetical protein
LKRSPDTATAEEIRLFQLHLIETRVSICNRSRIMTGLRFLFRVTLRRLDLAAEIYNVKEPQKIPLVMERAHRRASSASCLGLAQDSHWISGFWGGASSIGMADSRTQDGIWRGPATQRTSTTLERAASKGRQTGDISVRP